jgi:hypothetical protein
MGCTASLPHGQTLDKECTHNGLHSINRRRHSSSYIKEPSAFFFEPEDRRRRVSDKEMTTSSDSSKASSQTKTTKSETSKVSSQSHNTAGIRKGMLWRSADSTKLERMSKSCPLPLSARSERDHGAFASAEGDFVLDKRSENSREGHRGRVHVYPVKFER